jgi:hypothetical protein
MDNPRRSTPSLRQPLGSIGGTIRATYDARLKSRACVRPSSPPSMPSSIFPPVGFARIVQPRRQRSNSPHPRPVPILRGGTPQPPRGRIPPRPFRGGARTCPRPCRASRRHPQSSSSSSLPSSSSSAVSNPVARRICCICCRGGPSPSTRRGQARSKGADAPGVKPGLWDGGRCVVAFQMWRRG